MRQRIEVRERGYKDVSTAQWSELIAHEEFWRLVDQKIVEVSRPGPRIVRLHGTRYVGRATFGEIALDLVPKVEGALSALIGFATAEAFRVARVVAPASEIGELFVILVQEFLAAVRAYVSRGREGVYRKTPSRGSLVGGRLDVVKTLQLRARGFPHMVAFDRTVFSRRTPLNRVVLAAIREIETLTTLVDLPAEVIEEARALSLFFDDCRDVEVVFGARDPFVLEAERQATEGRGELERDAAALAGVLLSRESFERTAFTERRVPRAWFLNLETLFESAVRRILREEALDLRVTRGSDLGRRIFAASEGVADPDVAMMRESSAVCIGDAKYKQWVAGADRGDLYQLLVHASAFGAPVAFLVYPGEAFDARELGMAVTGSNVWLFCVDLADPRTGLRAALDLLEIPRRPAATVPPAIAS